MSAGRVQAGIPRCSHGAPVWACNEHAEAWRGLSPTAVIAARLTQAYLVGLSPDQAAECAMEALRDYGFEVTRVATPARTPTKD